MTRKRGNKDKAKAEEKEGKMPQVSFFNSQKEVCPVCGHKFQREELLTGGGRLNAGVLTEELHRLFQTTEKYGDIYPLIYAIWTCPECYFSALKEDFKKNRKETIASLQSKVQIETRRKAVEQIFGKLSFTDFRGLKEGISAYILGIYSYECFSNIQAPILKQGICAIRAAWLAVHLNYKSPDENYDYLARILYRKAGYFYNRAIELNDTTEQPLTTNAIVNYGPDVDHNFGMDGAIYLASALQYRYGQRSDSELRAKRLQDAKVMVSRLVGTGRASQSKPTVILNHGRSLYNTINQEMQAML